MRKFSWNVHRDNMALLLFHHYSVRKAHEKFLIFFQCTFHRRLLPWEIRGTYAQVEKETIVHLRLA
jgi:hypothetical protein